MVEGSAKVRRWWLDGGGGAIGLSSPSNASNRLLLPLPTGPVITYNPPLLLALGMLSDIGPSINGW